MPIHYSRPDKWAFLKQKQANLAPYLFYNEVLGVSYDTGAQLVTLTELLAAASLPWKNTWRNPSDPPDADARRMLEASRSCAFLTLGIDWGGGRRVQGKEEVSFTTLALVGWNSDGRLSALWGRRLLTPHDHVKEAEEIAEWVRLLKPNLIAHDFTGAGDLRETIISQLRFPVERLMPIAYTGPRAKAPVRFIKASDVCPRAHYQANRSRTLLYTCAAIKLGILRTFADDYVNEENPGLLRDFLALTDEQTEPGSSGGLYIIRRKHNASDDFAHAVNLGAISHWYVHDAWPEYARRMDVEPLPEIELKAAQGRITRRDWEDDGGDGGYFAA
jgi:hypothetical protein